MTTLDIGRLRSLVTVAAVSGVRPAADALHLSPAAVTGHIRKLERDLGCRLVMPLGRGISLTGDGEELVQRARVLLEAHDAAVRSVSAAADGELVVAASEHAAEFLAPLVVSAIDAEFPDSVVRLRLTRSERVRQLADDDRADVGLMLTSHTEASVRVTDLDVQWFGRPDAPRDALVLFAAPCALRHEAIASLGRRPHRVIRECADLSSVLSSARAGDGITPLPLTGPPPDGLRLVRELPPVPNLPLYVTFSDRVSDRTRSAVLTALRRHLARAS